MKKAMLLLILVSAVLVSGCIGQESEWDKMECAGMELSEAKNIAIASECGDRLKETYICNENTRTWWIDLEIEKEGCSPACVVHADTGEAEINWRCTGLLP